MKLFRSAVFLFAGALVIVVIGFWPSYFRVAGEATAAIHAHAALCLAWMLLLISQAALVRTRRFRWHRRLGRASYALVPLIVGFGLLVSRHSVQRGDDGLTALEIQTLTLPLYGLFQFVLAYLFAIANRHDPELHARLMVAACVPFLSAAVLRLLTFWNPGIAVHGHIVVSELIFVALILGDWRSGRVRAPFPAFLGLTVLWHPLYEGAADWPWWRAIAALTHG